MKILKRQPLVSIILGILIVTYSLLANFANIDFLNITDTVGNIIISLGLIAFAVLIVWPDMKRKNIAFIKTIEFVIIILAAVIGFILPIFNVDTYSIGGGSLWFGLALVINGGLDLYLGVYNRKSLKYYVFFIHLASVILGTWIYATNYVDRNLEFLTFITLLVTGSYLIIIGLLHSKK